MLSFMLSLKVKPDSVDTAVRVLSEIDRKANTHEGVVHFMWFQHKDEPVRFSMIESWRNQELLNAHIAKIIDIWNEITPNLDGEPISTKLTKLIQ